MERASDRDAYPNDTPGVRDSYGIALAALLASVLMVIAAGAPMRSFVALASVALQVLALGLTLRVSGVSRTRFRVGVWLLVATFVGLSLAVSEGGRAGAVVALLAWLVLSISAIVSILLRLRQYQLVNLAFVLGLLCIYLLIGLSFGVAYSLVDTLRPPVFAEGVPGLSGTVYFSFVTLATVGYGDYTPVNTLARAMAVAEAILGQLYLVSVVALAVSRFGSIRPRGGS